MIFRICFVLLESESNLDCAIMSAHLSVRVVLRTWDALAISSDGIMSDQSLRPVQDSVQAKSLIQELTSMLEIFEVVVASVMFF